MFPISSGLGPRHAAVRTEMSRFTDDRTTKLFSRQSLRPTIFHTCPRGATTTEKWPVGAFTGTTRAQESASVEYCAIRSAEEGPASSGPTLPTVTVPLERHKRSVPVAVPYSSPTAWSAIAFDLSQA